MALSPSRREYRVARIRARMAGWPVPPNVDLDPDSVMVFTREDPRWHRAYETKLAVSQGRYKRRRA